MFDTIAGLPVHVVLVHAAVVVVPAAALVVLLAAVWPAFRRWAGALPAVLGLLALALVPVATESGEALEGRVGETELVERHAELGDGMLPWVIGLAVLGVVLTWIWWTERSARRAGDAQPGAGARPAVPGGRAVALVVAVAALVVSVGAGYQVVQVGHSGAEAVWGSTVQNTQPGGEDDD